jgi:hypothetical protein
VRTLQRLGLVKLVDDTRVRGAVERPLPRGPSPTVSPAAWADSLLIAKQAAIASSQLMTDEYTAAAGDFDRGDAHPHLSCRSVRLDAEGFAQLSP